MVTPIASSHASAKPAEAVSAFAKILSFLASADYPLDIHPPSLKLQRIVLRSLGGEEHLRPYGRSFLRRRVIFKDSRFLKSLHQNIVFFLLKDDLNLIPQQYPLFPLFWLLVVFRKDHE